LFTTGLLCTNKNISSRIIPRAPIFNIGETPIKIGCKTRDWIGFDCRISHQRTRCLVMFGLGLGLLPYYHYLMALAIR